MRYIAIIGDIRCSKNIENRYKVQQDLQKVLEHINKEYQKELASKFLITLGDEFQGLLCSAKHLLKIIKYIQRSMYPVSIRFGVGIGIISTDINPEAAIGADGPAYYAAREMIEDLRNKEKKTNIQIADVQLSVYGEAPFEVEQINTLLTLIKIIEDKWKDCYRTTIWDLYENGGTQAECAIRLNTTQSTVARRLIRGNYYIYEKTMEVTSKTISLLNLN